MHQVSHYSTHQKQTAKLSFTTFARSLEPRILHAPAEGRGGGAEAHACRMLQSTSERQRTTISLASTTGSRAMAPRWTQRTHSFGVSKVSCLIPLVHLGKTVNPRRCRNARSRRARPARPPNPARKSRRRVKATRENRRRHVNNEIS
jgi:hypothetical protein